MFRIRVCVFLYAVPVSQRLTGRALAQARATLRPAYATHGLHGTHVLHVTLRLAVQGGFMLVAGNLVQKGTAGGDGTAGGTVQRTYQGSPLGGISPGICVTCMVYMPCGARYGPASPG